jgi:hypothetical protein
MFTLPSSRYAIVEINTDDPGPDAHQAIKYTVLMCARLRLPITSHQVQAILVVYPHVGRDIKKFFDNYSVRIEEMRPQ